MFCEVNRDLLCCTLTLCLSQVPMVLRNDAYSSAFSAPSLSLSQSRKIAWIIFCGSMNSLRSQTTFKQSRPTLACGSGEWLGPRAVRLRSEVQDRGRENWLEPQGLKT